jgi:hypothetical protein
MSPFNNWKHTTEEYNTIRMPKIEIISITKEK